MRNRRTLFLFIVIFAALVIVAYLQTRPAPLPPATAAPTPFLERIYPELAVLDIQAIRLENPTTGISFTISRAADGEWTAPDSEGVLDAQAATQIARTIALLPYQRTLELTDDTNLAEFGFEPNAQLFIQVVRVDGSANIVAVGALTASQAAYYALVDEREIIYLIESGPIRFLLNFLQTPPLNLTRQGSGDTLLITPTAET
ncbi:MAG: hypothetical protein H7175_04880 [Burkholderiales bacterium]|nr:hypothetical protein [Anaerolineae bacterium]